MEEKKVYIIVSGCYSDRSIERVFSTLEKANEYLDMHDDDYYLMEFELDKELPPRKTRIWRIVLELNTKQVKVCEICYERGLRNMIHFMEDIYKKWYGIEFYIESDSRKRAVKVASERYGAVIANEKVVYPYLRQSIIEVSYGDGYPYYDFTNGEVVLFDDVEFDDKIMTFDPEDYDEDRLRDYLPKDLRFRRAETEEEEEDEEDEE